MLNIFFLSLLAIAVMSAAFVPYITSGIYSLYSILQPAYVWPWTFPSIKFSFICAISMLFGLSISFLIKKQQLGYAFHKEGYLLLTILIITYLSEYMSPFQTYASMVNGSIVIDSMTTIVIVYFVQIIIIMNSKDPIKAIKFHSYIFIGCIVFYIYWANSRFLSGDWSYFKNGRLTGPISGPYSDENALAVLVVMGMPFLLNLVFFSRKKITIFISLFLLLGLWHSIFLFGSRGSFISLTICLLASFFLIKSNKSRHFKEDKVKDRISSLKKFIFVIFIIAVSTQASTLIKRSNEVVSNAKNEESVPLNPRILSWKVGSKLALDFPLLGVGPQRFQHASLLLYPGETIHVAHNTYIAFAANIGIPGSLTFIFLLMINLKSYNRCKKNGIENHDFLNFLNETLHISVVGFIVCSFFLDLIIFEPLFFILALNKSKELILIKLNTETTKNV